MPKSNLESLRTIASVVRIGLRNEIEKRGQEVYWVYPYELAVIVRAKRPRWLVTWKPSIRKARFVFNGSGEGLAVMDSGEQLAVANENGDGVIYVAFQGLANGATSVKMTQKLRLGRLRVKEMDF